MCVTGYACTIAQPKGYKCTRMLHSSQEPCAVVPDGSGYKCGDTFCKLCYPSIGSSDCIYKKELALEITKLLEMDLQKMLERYGQEGWRLLIKRYLEATSG